MIILDYNKQAGRYEIMCQKTSMDWGAQVPSKTFNVRRGIWYAKDTRLNHEYFTEHLSDEGLTVTPSASAQIEEFGKLLNVTAGDGRLFPGTYQFKLEPYKHQRLAVDTIYGINNVALFMDIGTGKTKVAIDHFSAHRMEGDIKQILVIALFPIRKNWEKEIHMNCPLPATVHLLDTSKAGIRRYDDFLSSDAHFKWLVVGVESLSQGKAFAQCQRFIETDKDGTAVCMDESSRIKTHNSGRTEKAIILGRGAPYKMIMTGSPITQGLQDLYSQFEFLDKNIIGIGNWYAFRNRYVVTIDLDMGGRHTVKKIVGYKNESELLETLNPHIFQVRKRDVLTDLPPKTYHVREIVPTKEQKQLYKDLKNDLYIKYETWIEKTVEKEIEGETVEITTKVRELTVSNMLTAMQRLHEITGGVITTEELNPDPLTKEKKPKIFVKNRLGKNPKLIELMSLLDEIGGSVVIFAVYIEELMMISEALDKKYGEDSHVLIYGAISEDQRHENIERFQKKEVRFLVGNQATAGTGLNMTAASTMIRFSNNFSADARIQGDGRIDRIGQTDHMHYIDMIMPGMVDERVLDVVNGKEDFAEGVRSAFDDGKLKEYIDGD